MNILNPGEVVYDDVQVYGVVNMAVILECGTTLPDIYIWGFTKQGTDKIKAVVYNFGHGPRMQALAATLGSVAVISHSASLSIDQLPRASEGLYTCQAFYERPEGPEFRYYYVRLTVRGETRPRSNDTRQNATVLVCKTDDCCIDIEMMSLQ